MPKYVTVELKPVVYVKIPVESDKEDLAVLEAGYKFNEMNIESINLEVIQSDGTIHIDRVDDWKIGDYKLIDDED